jgi:Arc/MetJ-type ribon-helix-helix transcriptional regulator
METLTIDLPSDLDAQLRDRIRDTEFDSLEEYVLFVLEEIVEDEGPSDEQREVDSEELEGRLEDLGYL